MTSVIIDPVFPTSEAYGFDVLLEAGELDDFLGDGVAVLLVVDDELLLTLEDLFEAIMTINKKMAATITPPINKGVFGRGFSAVEICEF